MQNGRHRLAVKQAPLKVVAGMLEGESGPAVRGRAHDGWAVPTPTRSVHLQVCKRPSTGGVLFLTGVEVTRTAP